MNDKEFYNAIPGLLHKVFDQTIMFKIPGDPRGKERPRRAKHGGMYTPSETIAYEKKVKACFLEAVSGCGDIQPTEGPVALRIVSKLSIPKAATKKMLDGIAKGEIFPTKKPDIDNIEKIVMDALEGLAYKNDSQVVFMLHGKHYSETPGVEVWVERIGK